MFSNLLPDILTNQSWYIKNEESWHSRPDLSASEWYSNGNWGRIEHEAGILLRDANDGKNDQWHIV